MLTRRAALGSLAAFGAVLSARPAPAQAFPTRPVTVIVPYPAGGPVDAMARLYANEAAGDLGQPVIVDNRPGASGMIGSDAAARAKPDGHLLVLGTNQTHATNQSLFRNCPYDAMRDFAPVAGLTEIQHVLVTRSNLKVGSVGELVTAARQMPDYYYCGSTGIGSASHLVAELFKIRTSTDLRHVPYRGAAALTTELLAKRVDLSFSTLPSVIALIESRDVIPLAVASAKRAARLPGVPTLKEAGVEGVEADAWFALFAPAMTPQTVIDRLYRSVVTAFGKDKLKDAVARQGMTLALTAPAALASRLPGEVEKWASVIKEAHVTVE
jgi:tripartite-type tricarboxylate transporter receptor subunit TctC